MIHLWCGLASFPGKNEEEKGGILPFLTVFLLDACYMTAVAAAFSFFVFWSNNGRFRWYMAAGTIAGMVLYFRTIGRLVEACLATAVRMTKKLLSLLVVKPLQWLFRFAGRAVRAFVGFAGRHTVIPLCRLIGSIREEVRTASVQKKLIRDIPFPDMEKERKREFK